MEDPKRYYSPGNRGFYVEGIHDGVPEDAVEITATRHAELLSAQAAGMEIIPGPDGAPQAAHPAAWVPTVAEVHALRQAAYRRESDPLYMEAVYDGGADKLDAWRAKVAEIKTRFPLP